MSFLGVLLKIFWKLFGIQDLTAGYIANAFSFDCLQMVEIIVTLQLFNAECYRIPHISELMGKQSFNYLAVLAYWGIHPTYVMSYFKVPKLRIFKVLFKGQSLTLMHFVTVHPCTDYWMLFLGGSHLKLCLPYDNCISVHSFILVYLK